jgi:copper(I)-binding protein
MAGAVPSRLSSVDQAFWSSTSVFPVTRRSALIRGLSLASMSSGVILFPRIAAKVASAHEIAAGALTIQHPWSRATAAGAKVGALYLTIRNTGSDADRLLGVSTDAAEKCELHLSETSGDVMTMRMVDSMDVPAGGSASFAPRGAHVMLVGLKAPLKKGAHFAATLHFEKAGDVAIEVAVQGIADLQPVE